MNSWHILALDVLLWASVEAADGPEAAEATCPSGDASCSGSGSKEVEPHWWRLSHGTVGRYSSTDLVGPSNLKDALYWEWHHPDMAVFSGAMLFDNEVNMYVPCLDGIRKFSKHGDLRWHYRPQSLSFVASNPSLDGNSLFGSTMVGEMFALDLATGAERWLERVNSSSEVDCNYVESHDGYVFAAFKGESKHGNSWVVARNATTGSLLWLYKSEFPLWNFMPAFADDGTFITMSTNGGVYRIQMNDSQVVWHKPPPEPLLGSFTDGGVTLGPGARVAYACSNHGFGTTPGEKGALRAYNVSDGALLWDKDLPQPCVSWPAVSSNDSFVVVPTGALPMPLAPQHIFPVVLFVCYLYWLGFRCWWQICCCKWRRCRCCAVWCHIVMLILTITSFPVLNHLALWLGKDQHRLWGGVPRPMHVSAFKPNGDLLWRYDVNPDWGWTTARAEQELFVRRLMTPFRDRPVCGPASWGAPAIDGRGTIYVGAMNGILYAIRDRTGTGVLEVDELDVGAPTLHAGPSFAPGLMAFASCDGLFVFHA